MIKLKNSKEISLMQDSGKICSEVLQIVLSAIEPGITLRALDKLAESEIRKRGGSPSFMTVDDYAYTTCININSGLVHGIPDDYEVKIGDLVSVDMGVLYKGYHSDTSYTVEVETNKETKFLEAGKEALNKAIKQCKIGNRIGDISWAMQSSVEKYGYSASEDLVGHGIGKSLHEDPYVPCIGRPKTGMKILPGSVFAIEIIYQKGKPDLRVLSDNWTIATADGSLGGLFEHTVAVTEEGTLILTK
jgi:methionyl aminopeptidase